MQTNLEEAKAQELAKLQNSLLEMQSKLDETNALLVKERENAKQVIEEAPPVIQETQVLVEDTEKIESLTAEVESLKVRKARSDKTSLLFVDTYFKHFVSACNTYFNIESCFVNGKWRPIIAMGKAKITQ